MSTVLEPTSATSALPAIWARGLAKRFGDVQALAGVDLEVPAGSLYLLAGANGAGKTTLLRLLLDLATPDRGEARVLGYWSARQGPWVRAHAGWVPDAVPPVWNGLRVGQLFAHQRRFYPTWDTVRESELCELLGVAPAARFGSLSRGERVLVMLVLALAHRPPVLLWDEPTASLDPLRRESVVRLLLDQVAEGVTVLLASHQVSEFDGVADRLGVLRSGHMLLQASCDELRRTLRRYEVEAPAGWRPADALAEKVLRGSATGAGDLVVRGEEGDVRAALAAQGATVRYVEPLTLAQATIAYLQTPGVA